MAATRMLADVKLIAGFALDLATAVSDRALGNGDSKAMGDIAMKKFNEERAMFLVRSSMCMPSPFGIA